VFPIEQKRRQMGLGDVPLVGLLSVLPGLATGC
jgi:hypothetical protein